MPSFADQWKKIKNNYEAATNRKKPSDTFLGMINTKTGLGSGFASMDAAIKSTDVKEAQKAHASVEKSATAYRKVLMKAAAAEKNKDIQKETNKMMDELEELMDASKLSIQEAGQLPRLTSLRDFTALMRLSDFERCEKMAKKLFSTEILEFLIAMSKKDYSLKTYAKFIKTNEVNIADAVLVKFDENDLKKAPWDKATAAVLTQFNNNIIAAVNNSPI